MKLNSPQSIALTPSGTLLVAENPSKDQLIRKMDGSGFLKVIAGGGSKAPSPDNPIPAKTASITPFIIAYAGDGSDAIFIGNTKGYIFMLSNRTKCDGSGPIIQPFAPVTVLVLVLMSAIVRMGGPGLTVRLHIALMSCPMRHRWCALVTDHALIQIIVRVMMGGSKAIALYKVSSHVLVSTATTHQFVLVMVLALVKINASVMMDGCMSIVRSLTALVSLPISLIECVQARVIV